MLQAPAIINVGAGKQETTLGNFYPPEHNPSRDYRWTKEVSRINTTRLSDDAQITLYLDGSRPASFKPSPITIVINGQPAATITATNGPLTYTLSYHDASILPDLSLELRTAQTFYPSDKDYRELGIIFYGMRVESAPGPLGLRWPSLLAALLWLLVSICLYAIGWAITHPQPIPLGGETAPHPRPLPSGGEINTFGKLLALALPFVALILICVCFFIASPMTLLPWLAGGLVALLPVAVFVQRRRVEAALAGAGGWLKAWRLWQRPVARVLAVPFFYLIATIVFTWPYVLSFGTRLPGWPMDNFNFMYKIWWVSHSIFGNPPPGSSLVFNPNVYYPIGFNLGQGELTPANTLLTIPITATLGPIVSYNFLVFLSFVLSGWGMYLLVKYLLESMINLAPTETITQNSKLKTKNSTLIALLIGLSFTFMPYRLNHMLGHLQMMGTQWLPLTFLFLEKMLRGRRWQDGALAGLFFALCCWEAWYYAAIIGLFVGLYIVVRWWQLRGNAPQDALSTPASSQHPGQQGGLFAVTTNQDLGQQGGPTAALTTRNSNLKPQTSNLKPLAAFILVTAALVAPFAIPYLALRSGNSLAYSVKAANGSSALLSDYFIPSQLHPIWGDAFKTAHTANLNLAEYNLWPGAAMYLLIGLGIWAGWKLRGKLAAFPFSLYIGMALLAVVLSFGLQYDLSGELARFDPALRSAGWQVPLPGLLLYKFVPLFSSIRAWARFGLIAIFAFYVIAALGLAWLLTRPKMPVYRYTLIIALAVLVLADFWATPYTWGFSRVEQQPLDAYLAALPGQPVVAMMPFDRATRDGPAMWASVYHGKPIAYGYETFMPNDYQLNEDTLQNLFPQDAALDVLKGWHVQYIAVSSCQVGSPTDSWCYGRRWPEMRDRLAASPRLKFIQIFRQRSLWDGDVGLFDVRPDIAWHASSDDVYLYQLVRLGRTTVRPYTDAPSPPRERGRVRANIQMPLTLGQQLDGNRYTVLAKLGLGGAGSVYKVQDNRAVPGMPVTLAVKEISVSGIADPVDRAENAAAFRSEVRLLMSLNHPNLTQVVNFFAEGDNYYLVMDFVDGKTLLKALDDADGPLPVSSVLDWFWQLCDVLVYLHGLDPPIIFRDLKPGNVMVAGQGGIVKLIDFGIARFFKRDSAADTRALGTPGYAPPEQYGRSQTDERSDIYSLGVTIYELLTNINPDEHIFNLPPALTLNPAIPAPLAAMLARMTMLEPEARYQTIIAVRNELAKLYPKPAHPTPPQTLRVLQHSPSPLAPPPKGEAGRGSTKAHSAPPTAQTPPSKGEAGRGAASRATDPPQAPPDGRGATTPQATRAIAGLDGQYLATPSPLPAARKVNAVPALPVAADSPRPPRTLPANNSKLKTQNSKLKTIVLALLLVGLIVGGSYFGLLPFSLPFIGTAASHVAPPDTLYPATVAAPPGVTDAALNSRSPRGQWWMSGYDWGGTNFSHDNDLAIAGSPLWSYPVNVAAYTPANLIIANEGYYIIAPGQTAQGAGSIALYLDASGQPAWSFDLPGGPLAMNRLAYAKSDKATFLYLQDGTGQLYASDPAAQGRATWRYNLGGPSPYAPVIANGVLYATTPLTLTALDAATGKQLWQSGGLFRSPPLLSPDASSVYVVNGIRLAALDPTNGKVKWQVELPVSATSNDVLLATADSIYVGTPFGSVIPFDAVSGNQLTEFSVGGEVAGFATVGNTLFVAVKRSNLISSNAVTARDTASGFERWTYPLSGAPVGSPIIVGDNLYVLSADSKLTILNTRSGALVKSITLPDAPLGEAAYANATLYYFGQKGLYALR